MSIGNLNLSNLLYGNQSINTDTTNSSYGNILSPNANGLDTSIFAKAIDTNKDGKISSEEFQAFLDNPSGILQTASSVKTNQDSSNSILQLILSLLTKALSNQQNTQESSVKSTPQAQASAPVTRSSGSANNATVSANKSIKEAVPIEKKSAITETKNNITTTVNADGSKTTVENKAEYKYKIETKYDASGKKLSEVKISTDPEQSYNLDATNNKIFRKTTYENGVKTNTVGASANSGQFEWNYDKNGNMTESKSYNANGDLRLSHDQEYNEKNERTHYLLTSYNDNKTIHNQSESAIVPGESKTTVHKYADESGKSLKTIIVKDIDSKTSTVYSSRRSETYDPNGNLTRSYVINTNRAGGLKDSIEKNYDEAQNVISFVNKERKNDGNGDQYEIKQEYKDGELITTKRYLIKDRKLVQEEAQRIETSKTDDDKLIAKLSEKSDEPTLKDEVTEEGNFEILKESTAETATEKEPAKTEESFDI